VQVKSRASRMDLLETVSNFSSDDFERIFLVVHSPARDLIRTSDIPEHIDIVSPHRLGQLALDAGLVAWLEDKVS